MSPDTFPTDRIKSLHLLSYLRGLPLRFAGPWIERGDPILDNYALLVETLYKQFGPIEETVGIVPMPTYLTQLDKEIAQTKVQHSFKEPTPVPVVKEPGPDENPLNPPLTPQTFKVVNSTNSNDKPTTNVTPSTPKETSNVDQSMPSTIPHQVTEPDVPVNQSVIESRIDQSESTPTCTLINTTESQPDQFQATEASPTAITAGSSPSLNLSGSSLSEQEISAPSPVTKSHPLPVIASPNTQLPTPLVNFVKAIKKAIANTLPPHLSTDCRINLLTGKQPSQQFINFEDRFKGPEPPPFISKNQQKNTKHALKACFHDLQVVGGVSKEGMMSGLPIYSY